MGERTAIEWCHHTFNPWVGCTKVSPACDHCYAEGWAKRTGHPELWQGERRRTSASNWHQPIKWNRAAAAAGVRRRVFCASLADVFDNQVPPEWRADLWMLIHATQHLDWLLLTKRPQNMRDMVPWADPPSDPWPNVWLGTTVENEQEAERRLPHLLSLPACVRFLSCEPLLAPIDLNRWLLDEHGDPYLCPSIHWVICGGESGVGARPMHPDWARSLRDQCAAAGVPFFMKQMDKKTPIPSDLFVRQFPHAA